MKSLFRGLSVSAIALCAAGCATPNPTPLSRPGDVPVAFTAPLVDANAPIWPAADWWTNFQADELPALEQTAQRENLDLAAANARILQAEATDEASFSSLLPTASVNPSFSRRKNPGQAAGGANAVTAGRTTNTFSITGSFNYALDIWGLSQDKLIQARESLRASRYAAAVTGLSIASTVANQYFTVLALRERITLARQNIEAANRILAVTQAKVTNGVSSNLELSQQQATVASQRARLPALIESEREARAALAILLGRAPEGFDIKGQNLSGIVSPTVRPGLPSEVLLRRPDVAQAEAQLFAAHANVDAARAAFFPSLSLTGSTGYTSAAFDGLVSKPNFIWSFGTSLLQTIFDGGRLTAQSDLAKAQQTELIATYRKTVFNAFSSVETELGQVSATTDQLGELTEAVRASTEAFRIAELQYREGTIDILNLLNAEQSLFNNEDALVQTRLARLQHNVLLYQQLGGGWTQQDSDAAYRYQLDWFPL